VDVFACRGYELYVTPLPQNEILVAALADAHSVPEPVAQAFERWRRGPRALAERMDGAEQVSELAGTSPLAGSARRGFVPGAILLGDAAGFLDPITGGGMTQALMSAELLAKHLWSGVPAGDDWLVGFDSERRSMLRDYRMLTRTVLWLSDHPRLAGRLLALLGDSPALLSHLVGVSGGVRRLLPPFPA
jgi:flavin-dependent dehydrogenase